MAPLVPMLSRPPEISAVPAAARDVATVLRAVERHPDAGARTCVTDGSTFRKAQDFKAGIAWRRGRYLLDWRSVEA